MYLWRGGARSAPGRVEQRVFGFVERSRRRQRAFKAAIVALSLASIVAIVAASPTGRHNVLVGINRLRWGVQGLFGLAPPRDEIEAERKSARRIGVERTRAQLARELDANPPEIRRLFAAAAMDPQSAVIRWGNFNQTLVLSSAVFETDDDACGYRFRPLTRSIWYIGMSFAGADCHFQVPDSPAMRAACNGLGGQFVEGSVQMTNSWGTRGPEPDPLAPLRGIVVGDSVIQGLLVCDDETPPACLERELTKRSGLRASVINAGVLGYSTEQYFYSFERYAPKMKPHFVVVGLCGNDFGDWNDPGCWEEACYWLDRIRTRCSALEIPMLIVPWPGEDALLGIRNDSQYPGRVTGLMKLNGATYFYPIEDFTSEELRIREELERQGLSTTPSLLYNRRLRGDNHMSPLGCALWGRVVAGRLHAILKHYARSPLFVAPGPAQSERLKEEQP